MEQNLNLDLEADPQLAEQADQLLQASHTPGTGQILPLREREGKLEKGGGKKMGRLGNEQKEWKTYKKGFFLSKFSIFIAFGWEQTDLTLI